MELEQVASETDYQILSNLYKRIKELQKMQKNNIEEIENMSLCNDIHRLINESIERIDHIIGKDQSSENLRLLAMKITLFYEKSKQLFCTENENVVEEILGNSLNEITNFMSKTEIIFLTLRIINHYAYLLIKRNDYTRAKEILEQAMLIYREAKTGSSFIQFFTSEDLFSSNTIVFPSNSSNKLERLVTNNLQLLAMIHENCEFYEKFAEYSHEVLERQIEMHEDELLMWPIKAAKLACFFIGKNRFKEARNHLAAATKILSKYEEIIKSMESSENSTESLELTKKIADIANCWVKYGLALFNTSKVNAIARFCQDPNEMLTKLWDFPLPSSTIKNPVDSNDRREDNSSSKVKSKGQESSRKTLHTISEDDESCPSVDCENKSLRTESNKILTEHEGASLLFRGLDLSENEKEVTASLIESTEEARMLFHHTHSWLKRVKLYYTLQDYPMEYVNTIMDLNELYRYLAFYEEDIESQYAVHKLRADALETLSAVLREVRPQCYIAVSIEILRELAEVQMEMMGLNLRRIFAAETSLPNTSEVIVEKIETLRNLHTKLKTFGDKFPEVNSFNEVEKNKFRS